MPNRYVICFIAILALTGCQLVTPPQVLQVPLSANTSLTLLTSWQAPPQQELVALTWLHPEHPSQSMQVSSLRDQQGVTMVGLSPLGQELWRARLDHTGQLQSSGIAPFDDPRLVQQFLATLQLATWPLAALQPQLKGAQLSEDNTGRKLISNDGQLLWQLARDGQHSQIEHLTQGYRIELHLLSREELDAVPVIEEQP